MKKTILTFVFILIGTLAFANNALNDFKSSKQYEELKKTFNLTDENFDFKNFEENKLENGKVSYYRMKVNNGKQNFLTLLKADGKKNFIVLYEKNNLNENQTEGYFEHYNEKGEFYADFIVHKVGNLYSFKINDVSTSKRLNISKPAVGTSCFTRTYQYMKKVCEADEVCDTLCDFVDACHAQMAIVAAAHCAVN